MFQVGLALLLPYATALNFTEYTNIYIRMLAL